MKNLILMFTLFCTLSCVQNPYPVYNLTPDERKWLVYKTNDTLVYNDLKGNELKLKVIIREERMFKIKDNLVSGFTLSENFISTLSVFPIANKDKFPPLPNLRYTKDESGFTMALMFKWFKNLDTLKLRDTTILNRKFTNCVFLFDNIKEIEYEGKYVPTIFSREKGIVAWNNSKNEVFVLVNR